MTGKEERWGGVFDKKIWISPSVQRNRRKCLLRSSFMACQREFDRALINFQEDTGILTPPGTNLMRGLGAY